MRKKPSSNLEISNEPITNFNLPTNVRAAFGQRSGSGGGWIGGLQRHSSHGHVSGHTGSGAAACAGHAHGHTHGHAVEQIELLIDEKCRILNKTGTPKSSALHLANWMKGQLDKQQQQARLAAIARSQENITAEDEQLIFNSDSEQDERITYWTRQQLEKRTKELNLAKENGVLSAKPNFGGKRLSGVEELSMSAASDIYSEAEAAAHSQISQSHSTTSDSQITVRSSPIVLDKLAVCRHCHKNCQQSGAGGGGAGGVHNSSSTPVLLCNSLKVQHSQSSPNRCCKLNGMAGGSGTGTGTGAGTGTGTGTSSVTSMSSSTITGELSSKVVASSSRRETGDTESDVAQLITDELSLSQSEATDESVGAIPNSSSSAGDGSKLRILEPQPTAVASVASVAVVTPPMANGHCSGGSPKPLPPPRRTRIVAQMCQEPARPRANQQVKAIVTITETARIMRSSERTAHSVGSGGSGSVSGSPAKYAACHCRCTPEDFTHAQLSPDKMEHQTCKLLESPKQTATTTCTSTAAAAAAAATAAQRQEDEQLSLVLIGLAQFAPAAKLCGQQERAPASLLHPATGDDSSTPTIAVVPPTPDAVLTKTSTHVWDNSGGAAGSAGSAGEGVATTSTTTTTTKQPRQAIIENIPEDSCDESPLDEEPPYRPMTNALRRFGTMSSLEKLPSDDRMDEADELDDDLEPYTSNGHDDSPPNDDDDDDDDDGDGDEDDDEDAASDKALAQNLNDLVGCSSSTGAMVNGDVLASGAWTNRAGAFVSDKMSFFEESRAFIDKYLGRWSAEDTQEQPQQTATSETDEQMDECTSGATSGEEVWGTPTSGGDNEDNDMQLINSENTHSSPTKSSTSLNDDDDTELMMDELLMAPPMTASTIRGLLPRFYRRRLEPLFEEETESDEEKTQQDSDDIKKVGGSNDKWPLPRGFSWKLKRRGSPSGAASAGGSGGGASASTAGAGEGARTGAGAAAAAGASGVSTAEIATEPGVTSIAHYHAAAHYGHNHADGTVTTTTTSTASGCTASGGLILRVSARSAPLYTLDTRIAHDEVVHDASYDQRARDRDRARARARSRDRERELQHDAIISAASASGCSSDNGQDDDDGESSSLVDYYNNQQRERHYELRRQSQRQASEVYTTAAAAASLAAHADQSKRCTTQNGATSKKIWRYC
ncbi:uncharacterized protein LOC111071657 [Drosophila obscura]|uniref:uncharacterized protein LOC111071657 n=1 Tax=Drosophila obscura TaxID=7282 RepID=UPI001BB0F9D2|nr:uncharacterized protein LOC111071657 [Drosophila obscura]